MLANDKSCVSLLSQQNCSGRVQGFDHRKELAVISFTAINSNLHEDEFMERNVSTSMPVNSKQMQFDWLP